MNKVIYDIQKNEKITDNVDWLIVSNYSPLCENLDDFIHIKNIFLIDLDNSWDSKEIFNNVDKIYVVDVNYKNEGIDYGIVREHFSKLLIGKNDLVCIDTSNLVLPIYSYIYAYLKDIVFCNTVWFMYHETKIYDHPDKYKLHDGILKPVQLECFRETENKKDELMIFLIGFEGSLTMAIDREKEPAKKIIINGFPSYLLSYKDASLTRNTHLFSDNYSLNYCTASNPYQTYNKLLSIYQKYKDKYKISIATCGSTPSSIGAIMFAASIDDVNIITTRPENYKHERREYKNRWIYKSP